VHNELKSMWKEVVVVGFKVLSLYFTGGTEGNHEKNSVMVACLQSEI
jgi:hypothetical protein